MSWYQAGDDTKLLFYLVVVFCFLPGQSMTSSTRNSVQHASDIIRANIKLTPIAAIYLQDRRAAWLYPYWMAVPQWLQEYSRPRERQRQNSSYRNTDLIRTYRVSSLQRSSQSPLRIRSFLCKRSDAVFLTPTRVCNMPLNTLSLPLLMLEY